MGLALREAAARRHHYGWTRFISMQDQDSLLGGGAFADASSFRALHDLLVGVGVTVLAPANPLRGLSGGGKEVTLAPEGFHESFCADIPADDDAFYDPSHLGRARDR